ncbi:2TM domain-containing protein [Niveispirillum sp. SYP-B3756]|uniref:2TM domain-containing protein n=1 Tax=Niveispirillum sp. SYP-B3756 TaxID=2662178 RepID=UPI001563C1A1|nr:2TM domain-containing protein [Niveispirillum sp. SYP-B3756]
MMMEGLMHPDPQANAADAQRSRQRRSALINHILAYMATAVVLVPVNFLLTPETVWFYIPLVAWMAPLALHVAYAMGMFDNKQP